VALDQKKNLQDVCDTKYRRFNGEFFVECNKKQLDTAKFISLATGFKAIKNEGFK